MYRNKHATFQQKSLKIEFELKPEKAESSRRQFGF